MNYESQLNASDPDLLDNILKIYYIILWVFNNNV